MALALTAAACGLLLAPAAAGAASAGIAQFKQPAMPLRIDSRLTLKKQFGYVPSYVCNVPSFDAADRPYIRSRGADQHITRYIYSHVGGSWRQYSFLGAVRRVYPTFKSTVNAGGYVSERVEVDALGRLYTLLEIRLKDGSLRNVLLYSLDQGLSWDLVTLPFPPPRTPFDGRDIGTATSEHLEGTDFRAEPPLIGVWRPVEDWPGPRASRNELYVLQPYFSGNQLVLPQPTLVTDRFPGMVQAAGGASFATTSGETSYIVWTELVPPGTYGSPTYVAAFDHQTATVSTPTWVGDAIPSNDDHTAPGICLDAQGIVHTITGAHNAAFHYSHSLVPLDVSAMSAPVQVLTTGYASEPSDDAGRGRQTYLSLESLPDGTLVIAFRQARKGVDSAFRGQSYEALCVQRLAPGGAWSPPKRLVYSRDKPGYAQYFQKLSVDRRGRLFISASYFRPNSWPPEERPANKYHFRMVLFSDDGGVSWRLATNADFISASAGAAG